jgi:GDP-4-dehydro-6-deoxy-D-mannose reductase
VSGILVTGARGFVGRHLCAFLRDGGGKVVEVPAGLDIRDPAAVMEALRRSEPEAILHLAGFSSVASSHARPHEAYAVNTLGTVNLLTAVRDLCPRVRVLLVSSGEVYGRLVEREPASESTPVSPLSPYASSKVAAEEAARQFERAAALEVIRVRPFPHLGAGQSKTFVVPSLAAQVASVARGESKTIRVGELSVIRDFTHVADVVRAYQILLERGQPGEVYNVCTGHGFALTTVLETLLHLVDVEANIQVDRQRLRSADVPWLVGNPAKMEALGWRPERRIEDALRDVLAENGLRDTNDRY